MLLLDRALPSLLALICVSWPPYMLVLAIAPPHYLFLPISLKSLDREGVRLLSPRDSQITSKIVAGADDARAGEATQLKWELVEDRVRCVVLFPFDQ